MSDTKLDALAADVKKLNARVAALEKLVEPHPSAEAGLRKAVAPDAEESRCDSSRRSGLACA